MIRFKKKIFTLYDETDNLKRMKDSDILAEKKRSTSNFRNIAGAATVGTIGGGILGGATTSTARAIRGRTFKGFGNNLLKGSKYGMAVGGFTAGGIAYLKGRKQSQENAAYNKRLKYAQTQALRREKKDWKTNMTQRDGYSY